MACESGAANRCTLFLQTRRAYTSSMLVLFLFFRPPGRHMVRPAVEAAGGSVVRLLALRKLARVPTLILASFGSRSRLQVLKNIKGEEDNICIIY